VGGAVVAGAVVGREAVGGCVVELSMAGDVVVRGAAVVDPPPGDWVVVGRGAAAALVGGWVGGVVAAVLGGASKMIRPAFVNAGSTGGGEVVAGVAPPLNSSPSASANTSGTDGGRALLVETAVAAARASTSLASSAA
jgi:hypothetical protein